jgi:hypothetical protein
MSLCLIRVKLVVKTGLTVWLITLRSEVQIYPPLPVLVDVATLEQMRSQLDGSLAMSLS